MARCFTLLGTSLAENFITIFITTRRNREVLRTCNLHYANEESIKVKGLWGGAALTRPHPAPRPPPRPGCCVHWHQHSPPRPAPGLSCTSNWVDSPPFPSKVWLPTEAP